MGKSEAPSAAAKGMFGPQHVSHRLSAPRYGFGSGTRDSYTKMHMTEAHSRATNAGRHSPGPVYPAVSSLGRIEDSRRPTLPQSTFSRDERFPAYGKHPKAFASPGKTPVPGAGTYEVPGAVGKQLVSTKQSAPRFGFGTAPKSDSGKQFHGRDYTGNTVPCSPGPTVCANRSSMGPQPHKKSYPSWLQSTERRFKYADIERAAKLPAAGSYDHHPGMGIQPVSKMKSMPQFSFGTGNRDNDKVYLSDDHSKELYGKVSPGPATLVLEGCVGRQVEGRRRTQPGWGFGSADRFAKPGIKSKKLSPGPGAYSPQ